MAMAQNIAQNIDKNGDDDGAKDLSSCADLVLFIGCF